MGGDGSFWTDSSDRTYDPLTRSLLAGVGDNNEALLAVDGEDNNYSEAFSGTGIGGSRGAKTFGLLRATAFAYGKTLKSGCVDGPFLTAYGEILENLKDFNYRDPTLNRVEQQLTLVPTGSELSLATLMAMLSDKGAYGTDDLTWTLLFGPAGLAKYSDMLKAVTDGMTTGQMAVLGAITKITVPAVPKKPTLPEEFGASTANYVDAIAGALTAPEAPVAVSPTAPATLDYGNPTDSPTASASEVGSVDPVLSDEQGVGITAEDVTPDDGDDITPPPFHGDLPNSETDLAISQPALDQDYLDAVALLIENIVYATAVTIPELNIPSVGDTGLIPGYDPTAYTPFQYAEATDITPYFPNFATAEAADPSVTAPTITAPTEVTVADNVNDAVKAFTNLANLRAAADLSQIQASLALSRQVMTTHLDIVNTLHVAMVAAQAAEYDKSLRVEQTRQQAQASISHRELLQRNYIRVEELKQQKFAEYYNRLLEYRKTVADFILRYKELERSDARFRTELSAKYYTTIADNQLRHDITDAELQLRAKTTNVEIETNVELKNAELKTQSALAAVEQETRTALSLIDSTLRAAVATAENLLRARISSAENILRARTSTAENTLRATSAGAENKLRAAIATAENMLRAALANAENNTRVSLQDAEVASRFALAGADNFTRASLAAGEMVIRASVEGASNQTRVALAHAENLLRASVTIAENVTRVSMANAEGHSRISTTNAENNLRASIANAEDKLRTMELRSRYDLADLENKVRIAIASSDIELRTQDNTMRRDMAENERILATIRMRSDLAKAFYDTTLGWMSARTANASVTGNLIQAGMQNHTIQTTAKREFDITSEKLRWDIKNQENSTLASMAELRWKALIQNLMTIKEACSAFGMVPTGVEHHPSGFDKIGQGISAVGSTIATGINLFGLF